MAMADLASNAKNGPISLSEIIIKAKYFSSLSRANFFKT